MAEAGSAGALSPSLLSSLRPSLPPAQCSAAGLALAALRARGASRFDPVQFCFIEALDRRSAAHQGEARRLLDDKLRRLLSAYGERFDQAQAAAARAALAAVTVPAGLPANTPSALTTDRPALAGQPQRSPAGGPLAELVRHIDRQAGGQGLTGSGDGAGQPGAPTELKAMRLFRSTWAQLSIDQLLAQSLAQQPEHAGPLNSHLLVLRALKLMREVSPAYLGRFMAYVDALLWLDQAASGSAPASASLAPRAERDKKRGKPGRGAVTSRP